MRRLLSLKSDTCTEQVVVDAAGISGKVKVFYPGRSADLPALRRCEPSGARARVAERRREGSAEVSRGHSRLGDGSPPVDPTEGPNTLKQAGA